MEIAKELQISDATVLSCVKRLMDARIIRRFRILTDNNLLGYNHLAFIGTNIRPGSANELIAGLSQIDEILEIHEIYALKI